MEHHAKYPPCRSVPETLKMRPFQSLRMFSSSSWIYQPNWGLIESAQLEQTRVFLQKSLREEQREQSVQSEVSWETSGKTGNGQGTCRKWYSDTEFHSVFVCSWTFSAVPVALKISKGQSLWQKEKEREQGQTPPSSPSLDVNRMCNVIGMAGCFSFWGPMFHPFHNPIRQAHKDRIVKTVKLRTEGNEMSKVAWRGQRAVLPDSSPCAQRHACILVSGCQSCVPLKNRCPVQLSLQSNAAALGQQGEQEVTSETQHLQLCFPSQGPGSRHFSK